MKEIILTNSKVNHSNCSWLSYKLKGAPKSVRGDRRGLFARASWGQHYHMMCKPLDMLASFIESKVPDVEIYGR